MAFFTQLLGIKDIIKEQWMIQFEKNKSETISIVIAMSGLTGL
jgi:hypothetical protein